MTLHCLLKTLACAGLIITLAISGTPAQTPKKDDKKAAKKDKPSTKTAEDLLKPGSRPKKPPLPPSELPLKFVKGERIAFVGNSLAERMNIYGHFEPMLHYRHPDLELEILNFGRRA